MKSYDEQTTARLYATSDKRFIVLEDDERARFLVAIHGPVTRADARTIRGYRNGEEFLEPINPADVPVEEAVKAAPAAKAPHPNRATKDEGPDLIVDWGRTHKGKRVGNLPDKYLKSLTKGTNPKARKALATAEIKRRAGATEAPPAPAAPLNYGADDVVSIGIHQDVQVRDLPEDFLTSLSIGAEEAHHAWTKAELQRRIDGA